MNEQTVAAQKLKNELWYSVRRFFVDIFFAEQIALLAKRSKIIDIGGKKDKKRGVFDVEKYEMAVKYANLDQATNPDYLCDATNIPVNNAEFDVAILGEVLEHVINPMEMILEAFRILKPKGKLLITTPFMYHLHADPFDYARYTDQWYEATLTNCGFQNIQIYKHGNFFSVLANMAKLSIYELNKYQRPGNKLLRNGLHKLVSWFVIKAINIDKRKFFAENWFFNGHTTGFGIVCEKSSTISSN